MADRAAALAALKAKRKAKDTPAPAPSYRRPAPSAPAPSAYKTSSASSSSAASPSTGAPPKILVLNSSSPAKPPPESSRNGAQNRGALPPAPKRSSYLDYDEGDAAIRVDPRGPAHAPLSSSPLASGSGGYFPRPDKRPGQSSLGKSRLGSAGPSVIPLRLSTDGQVVDALDDDDDDEFASLDPNVHRSRKLVRHNSAAASPLTGTPLSSRQNSPASQASTSNGLATQFNDAFIDRDDATITRFANMFPAVSRSRVVKVLEQSGWEASVAADVLFGLAPARPTVSVVDLEGTVVDDEDDAPAKSKAVSAIYAKRRTSEGDGREKKKKKRRYGNGSDSGSGDDYGDEGASRRKSGLQKWERDEDQEEEEALVWFNTCTPEELLSITSCSATQAAAIVSLRPFDSTDDLRAKLTKRKGISPRLFDGYIEVMQGYHEVDAVLKGCEKVGRELERAMSAFMQLKEDADEARAGELSVVDVDIDIAAKLEEETDELRRDALKGYIKEQPKNIAEGVQLKDYQMLGVNWLNLLFNRGLSCILADEMGLGKTIQVIAFLAHIKAEDFLGPHLIIVPSSTLENWAREFARFAPSLEVQTYYGSQAERFELSNQFMSDDKIDVILTTYQIASGTNKDDRKFLKRMKFQTAFFDEGHQLKNYKSARYKTLMDLPIDFRVLLTGTPLQNNLQELVSVLNFILPDYFKDAEDSLRAIFKVSSDSHASLLSRQRVSRAQKMMKPFVLRRRKDQVLKDLPKKNLFVEYCPMTKGQAEIYRESEISSSRTLKTLAAETEKTKKRGANLKGKDRVINNLEWDTGPSEKKIGDSGSNVLMNLRKAANHPLLFRSHYTDAKLKILAKDIMKEPEHMAKDYACIIEDMEIMTDAELDNLCKQFKSTRKHVLDRDAFFDSGKVTVLKRLIDDAKAQGKRLLVFSMFTQVLDIIKRILDEWKIRWIKLTGETKVDERQGLVDEFTNDDDITVFLLSTLAGGMGINLTAASVVVIYDQGFNPHNEKQAADRSYRIGQTQDVEVYTLISTGTIDEDINDLALSKLALDAAVAGREADDGANDNATEAKAKSSLLSKLRTKLEVKLEGGQPEAVKEEVAAGEGGQVTTPAPPPAVLVDDDMSP